MELRLANKAEIAAHSKRWHGWFEQDPDREKFWHQTTSAGAKVERPNATQLRGILSARGYKCFLILVNDEPVGHIGIARKGNESHLSIYVNPDERGRLIGLNALQLFKKAAMQAPMKFGRVVADIRKDHDASTKLFMKAGAIEIRHPETPTGCRRFELVR